MKELTYEYLSEEFGHLLEEYSGRVSHLPTQLLVEVWDYQGLVSHIIADSMMSLMEEWRVNGTVEGDSDSLEFIRSFRNHNTNNP